MTPEQLALPLPESGALILARHRPAHQARLVCGEAEPFCLRDEDARLYGAGWRKQIAAEARRS